MTPFSSPGLEPRSERAGLSLAQLSELLSEYEPAVTGEASLRVNGICQDSRRVRPGELFAARPGGQTDGATFAREALARGAVAVLAEHTAVLPELGVPLLRVTRIRPALARAAEAIHGFPSQRVALIGITGTNGKTTTCSLLEHALSALAARPARLGTLGYAFSGEMQPSTHTTPEADEISRLLARAAEAFATHFVMEVSSIALDQERVSALTFDVAAFSNLTQDHLEFHGSMEQYAAAKARLFTELSPKNAVINLDDAFGRELARSTRARCWTVSQEGPADVRVLHAEIDERGINATVQVADRTLNLQSHLIGAHNLDNLLLALGTLLALGYAAESAARALGSAPGVPGRLERCDGEQDDLLVVVDYAHTPDALSRVLSALKPLTRGQVRCVFGCGGDRDPAKRSKMGAVVARLSDHAIITNDNPRSEDPESIAQAILAGFAGSARPPVVELDRARAITRAVVEAKPGDTVLIAGKGHETQQIIGHEQHPFDDRQVARQALLQRRAHKDSRS